MLGVSDYEPVQNQSLCTPSGDRFLKWGRPYGIFPPDRCGTAAFFDWPNATVSPAMAALEIVGDESEM